MFANGIDTNISSWYYIIKQGGMEMLEIFKNKLVIIFVVTVLAIFYLGALQQKKVMDNNENKPELVSVNIR
jgi:hypothetical protein